MKIKSHKQPSNVAAPLTLFANIKIIIPHISCFQIFFYSIIENFIILGQRPFNLIPFVNVELSRNNMQHERPKHSIGLKKLILITAPSDGQMDSKAILLGSFLPFEVRNPKKVELAKTPLALSGRQLTARQL